MDCDEVWGPGGAEGACSVGMEGALWSGQKSTTRNTVPHGLVCAAKPKEMRLLMVFCDFLSHEICEWILILSCQMVLSEASTEGNHWYKITVMGSMTGWSALTLV